MMTMLMRRFGWVAAVLALLLAVGMPLNAVAQDAEFSGIPDGASDGALISFTPGADSDPQAPIYAFTIFSFEDDGAAESAFDSYIAEFEASLETDDVDSVRLVEVTGDDAEGLDEFGDQRVAFRVETAGDALSGFGFGILLVREGDTLHAWTSLVLDLSGLSGDTDATATTLDPNAPVDALLSVAMDWFDGDRPEDGALIERLPGLEQLPDGYEEVQRAVGLDEIEAATEGAGI